MVNKSSAGRAGWRYVASMLCLVADEFVDVSGSVVGTDACHEVAVMAFEL